AVRGRFLVSLDIVAKRLRRAADGAPALGTQAHNRRQRPQEHGALVIVARERAGLRTRLVGHHAAPPSSASKADSNPRRIAASSSSSVGSPFACLSPSR